MLLICAADSTIFFELTLKPRLHDTTCCQTGCQTRLTTGWMFVYTIQPVVNPVVQPVWEPVVSCKRGLIIIITGIFYWIVNYALQWAVVVICWRRNNLWSRQLFALIQPRYGTHCGCLIICAGNRELVGYTTTRTVYCIASYPHRIKTSPAGMHTCITWARH